MSAKASFFIEFEQGSLRDFYAACNATIKNVERGTKAATEEACKGILEISLRQVPRDTRTLMNSGYYEVIRRKELSANTWSYQGTVGYGGNGDPRNPKSGRPASSYMVKVHEDMKAFHIKGKAKFLEDAVTEYARNSWEGVVQRHWMGSIRR